MSSNQNQSLRINLFIKYGNSWYEKINFKVPTILFFCINELNYSQSVLICAVLAEMEFGYLKATLE